MSLDMIGLEAFGESNVPLTRIQGQADDFMKGSYRIMTFLMARKSISPTPILIDIGDFLTDK